MSSRLDFPDRADTFGISKENFGNGRLFKTYFPNHDENVVSMLAKISSGDGGKEEMMTVDGMGGLTIIDIDPLSTSLYKCHTVELFEGKQLSFTCSDYNSVACKLYLGTTDGAVWETDFESVAQLNINHADEITAIVSTLSALFSAGKDHLVHMYSLDRKEIIATISSEFDIRFLHMFTGIRGCPVAIADSSGCVSVWSPHRLKKSKDRTVQNVCNLNENLIALFEATVFHQTAMVSVTSGWIRIWSVATTVHDVEVLSILNDEVFCLMRSIEAPDRVKFTTACVVNTSVPSIITGCDDGSILEWEPNFGSLIRRFSVSSKPTSFILFIPSQHVIVSCDVTNTMCVIDPYSTPCVNQLGPVSNATVTCAAACEVSRIVIAVGDAHGRLFKYDGAKASTSTDAIPGNHAVTAIEVMITKISNHVVVIAGYANGLLETYIFNGVDSNNNCDFSTATKIRTHAYDSPVTFIRNADDDRVITACKEGDTVLWNVTITGISTCFEKIKVLENCHKVNCIGINPRNDIFVMGSMQGDLLLWDTKNWKEIFRIKNAHADDAVRSVGFMYNEKKLARYVVSVGMNDSLIKCWKLKANKLILENSIELPAICERAEVWGREESSLLFVQTKTGLLYVLDILQNSLGPLRFFSVDETVGSFWQVCGTHTAMFIDVDDETGKVNVWNNDLTPAESSRARITNIFNECLVNSHRVSPALDSVMRNHPLYPTFLLETDPHNNGQTLFSRAILGKFPNFLTKYLSVIPEAVVQQITFKGKQRSLLWLALKLADYESVDCIIEIWLKLLLNESDNVEQSAFSTSELMNDLKVLSRELPAKFADMVTRLSIPKNHVINVENCHSRFIRHGHYWMRGSTLRAVRGFWSHVEKREYPDLATRRLEPEEEVYLYHLEAPHASDKLQMPFTCSVESSQRKAHPSIRYAEGPPSPDDEIVLDDWDDDDAIRLGMVNRKKFAPEKDKGSMVQAYVHPIPYAAAGTEFLKLCQRCTNNTGLSDVMSAPVVATVLDYKWHTYFKDLHHASLFHYAFVLILFTLHCINFDHMMDAPAITGLPVLALVVTCFLIVSYVLLFAQECITFLSAYLDQTRRMWFIVGVMAYVTAITGLSIQIRAAFYEIHMSSSFTGRSVLSVATVLLYFKFLNYMTPVDYIGPLVYRVLFTIGTTIHYFIIVLMAIASFAICFNLQQTRKEVDTPVDSFYGSIMQSLFMATGGFDLDFIEESDSPLFTSFFYFGFVMFVILIILIILISATTESYYLSYTRSLGAWRAEQARIILQKSYLLPNEENLKPFHNPKWLHILAPVGTIDAFKGEDIDEDNVVTGNPGLFGGGSGGGGGHCDCEHPLDVTGPTAKFISKEVDELQDMLSELNNRIAAKKCVDIDLLADKVSAKLMETLKDSKIFENMIAALPTRSPRLPQGPIPSPYVKQTSSLSSHVLQPPPEKEMSSDDDMTFNDAQSSAASSPRSAVGKPTGHSSIRIRSIKSSKKKFSRQISSASTTNSDDENDEIERKYRKKLIPETTIL